MKESLEEGMDKHVLNSFERNEDLHTTHKSIEGK